MIRMRIKNLDDFKRLVRNRGTVYFTRKNEVDSDEYTYYVLFKDSGVDTVIAYGSDEPLKFTDGFNPEESEGINITFLVEIEELTSCCMGESS